MTAWFNSTGTPDGSWYSGIHMKGHNGYTSWELCIILQQEQQMIIIYILEVVIILHGVVEN